MPSPEQIFPLSILKRISRLRNQKLSRIKYLYNLKLLKIHEVLCQSDPCHSTTWMQARLRTIWGLPLKSVIRGPPMENFWKLAFWKQLDVFYPAYKKEQTQLGFYTGWCLVNAGWSSVFTKHHPGAHFRLRISMLFFKNFLKKLSKKNFYWIFGIS